MVDPKLFDAMKPEQAARAAVALVIMHALIQRSDTTLESSLYRAFSAADEFLARALKG